MMKRNAPFFIFIAAIICFFSSPLFVSAVTQISLNIPGTNNASVLGPGAFVANFYQFALMIGGYLRWSYCLWRGTIYGFRRKSFRTE